jgi:hypothetical protein
MEDGDQVLQRAVRTGGPRVGRECWPAMVQFMTTVLEMQVPGGFDRGISDPGRPEPRVMMPPPGVSAMEVWRELDRRRARPRDGSDDPQWQIRLSDGRRPRHPHGADGQGVTS